MPDGPTDPPLALQCSAKQRLHHPDLQVQVLPRHLRPHQDPPEDQRATADPRRVRAGLLRVPAHRHGHAREVPLFSGG